MLKKNSGASKKIIRRLQIAILLLLAALAAYGRMVWPFIHGEMERRNIGFFEAAANETILVGGAMALLVLVVAAIVAAVAS